MIRTHPERFLDDTTEMHAGYPLNGLRVVLPTDALVVYGTLDNLINGTVSTWTEPPPGEDEVPCPLESSGLVAASSEPLTTALVASLIGFTEEHVLDMCNLLVARGVLTIGD